MSTSEDSLKRAVIHLQSVMRLLEGIQIKRVTPSANKLRVKALHKAHEVAGALLEVNQRQ